jgi:NADH:ubiquinone oxidoreductase subunit 4 (subunit M)
MLVSIYLILILSIVIISFYNFKISHNDFVFYRKTKFFLLFSSSIVFLLSSFLLLSFDKNNLFFQFLVNYNFSYNILNIHCLLGLDGVSILFFVLSSFLTFLCAIFNWTHYSFRNFGISLLVIFFFFFFLF